MTQRMSAFVTELEATSTQLARTQLRTNGVILSVRPLRACVRLHIARVDSVAEVVIAGVSLPRAPNRAAGEQLCALWVAPDQWLLVSKHSSSERLLIEVEDACRNLVHIAVDNSHGLERMALSGPGARSLLAGGCGLDLAFESFPPGRCSGTRLAQLGVLIHCVNVDAFEIYVESGAARWLWDWLEDASVAESA